jgi:tRNA(Ile)-lysidine synthase
LQKLSWQNLTALLKKTTYNKFIIALSGGIDSAVLLHLCSKVQKHDKEFSFVAVHINHQLQEESYAWVNFCQKLCDEYNIPFKTKKIKLNKNSRYSPEEYARTKRYKAIKSIRKNDQLLLCAHHQNDNIETFFLRLLRGTGLIGLGSMQEHIEIYNMPLLRPFLKIQKKQIIAYSKTYNIPHITDKSNFDMSIPRNLLRVQILPLFAKINPYFYKNIIRTIIFINSNNDFVQKNLLQRYQGINFYQKKLPIRILKEESEFACIWILRYWLFKSIYFYPNYKKTYEIIRQTTDAKNDNKIHFYLYKKYYLKFYYGNIYIVKEEKQKLKDGIKWNFKVDKIRITKNFYLKKSVLTRQNFNFNKTKSVSIYFARKGASIKINEKSGHVRLKKIFQKYKVPTWDRQKTPLLYKKDELVAIYGLITAEKYK